MGWGSTEVRAAVSGPRVAKEAQGPRGWDTESEPTAVPAQALTRWHKHILYLRPEPRLDLRRGQCCDWPSEGKDDRTGGRPLPSARLPFHASVPSGKNRASEAALASPSRP